jgi:hypothetical protein
MLVQGGAIARQVPLPTAANSAVLSGSTRWSYSQLPPLCAVGASESPRDLFPAAQHVSSVQGAYSGMAANW